MATTESGVQPKIDAASSVDFLLSIREEKFAVMFDFFQNTGWIIGLVVSAAWFVIRWFSRTAKPLPDWSLLGCCSILTFFFGALLAVRSSGTFPQVIMGYGTQPPNCGAQLDTSRLKSFRDDYKVALVCGFNTTIRDQLDDDIIAVSSVFHITGGGLNIIMPYSEKMRTEFENARNEAVANHQPQINVSVWHFAILLSNNVEPKQVTKLDDVYSLKGKILAAQYFK